MIFRSSGQVIDVLRGLARFAVPSERRLPTVAVAALAKTGPVAHLRGMTEIPFRPRTPWWGGDLQTLRNQLVGASPDLAPWPAERIVVHLPDGDRLPILLHSGAGAGRPLVVLVHGVTGCETSIYVRAAARWFLSRGWPVLRINLRGAGPAGPLCSAGSYHAGRSEDLRSLLALLRWQRPELVEQGVLPVGFSLGANMLLKFLAENDFPVSVPAAATVSAPIDLKAAQLCLTRLRNALYHRYILSCLRAELRASAQQGDAEVRRRALAARSIWAFDECWTAPNNGFAGADDYYRQTSASRFLPAVRVPTMMIHALDDPWIPAAPYRAVDWSANRLLVPLLPGSGGHVGFHAADRPEPWHDRMIEAFFADRLGLESAVRRSAA